MAKRILVIDDTVKQKVADILTYAEGHQYDPFDKSEGWMDRIPGNNPKLQCSMVDGFRCVFSYTLAKHAEKPDTRLLVRHLSVSVDGPDLPGVPAVLMIAELFGFTRDAGGGPIPNDWVVDVRKKDHQIDDQCIVLAQEVKFDG